MNPAGHLESELKVSRICILVAFRLIYLRHPHQKWQTFTGATGVQYINDNYDTLLLAALQDGLIAHRPRSASDPSDATDRNLFVMGSDQKVSSIRLP
jgi:hypothetical protein